MNATRIAAATAAALALSSCGEDGGPVTTPGNPNRQIEEQHDEQSELAGLGDTVTLETVDTTVEVTVEGVLDPAPVGEFDEPADPNARFVGIELEYRNIGGDSFGGGSFAAGGTLITDSDREAAFAFPSAGPCSSTQILSLSPGDTRRGCAAFEVTKGEKADRFQFRVDDDGSQTGSEPAEWDLSK